MPFQQQPPPRRCQTHFLGRREQTFLGLLKTDLILCKQLWGSLSSRVCVSTGRSCSKSVSHSDAGQPLRGRPPSAVLLGAGHGHGQLPPETLLSLSLGYRTSLRGDGDKPFSAVFGFPYEKRCCPSSYPEPVVPDRFCGSFSATGARWGPTVRRAPCTQLSAVRIWRRRGRPSGWGCAGGGHANHWPEWKAA